MADLRSRPIGATATLGRTGYPAIRSETGGELDVVTGPSQPGFNPLDLLLASLAACMSMSARIAARELGFAKVFDAVAVEVAGEKSKHGSSRFESFTVTMRFKGSLSPEEQTSIAHRAEELCTVSNSLSPRPIIVVAAS